MLICHPQTGILVLQHDGHFVGIPLAQEIGNIHARVVRLESDVEMMAADEALFLDSPQRLADHSA